LRHSSSSGLSAVRGGGVWFRVMWHWLPTSEYSQSFGGETGQACKGLMVNGEIIFDWLPLGFIHRGRLRGFLIVSRRSSGLKTEAS
jgi:hypothetical protein